MILVTGATGNIGAELVAQLAGAGAPVRALTRRPDAALPAGATAVGGDLNEPASLRPAFDGVEGVFLLPGYADMAGLAAEIARAGIERVVLLSGGSAASGDLTNAVTRYMVESENALRDRGIAATILRPSAFMSNTLRWLDQLRQPDPASVRLPFATVRAAVIDPYDLAAVAAVALTTDGHAGRIYQPTGPEALTPADQIAAIAEVLGRDLRFEAEPNDEARARMLETTPVEYVDAFFDFYVAGSLDESPVRPTVRELTGREPRTYREWVGAHAAELR